MIPFGALPFEIIAEPRMAEGTVAIFQRPAFDGLRLFWRHTPEPGRISGVALIATASTWCDVAARNLASAYAPAEAYASGAIS